MATRENQGLQIGLIVCVIAIVFLMVFWILTWKKLGEMDTVVATAKKSTQDAQRAMSDAINDSTTLKQFLGYPQEAEIEEIQNRFNEDMTKFAENYPDEKRNYRELAEFLVIELVKRSNRVTTEVANVDQMTEKRDQARQEAKNSSDEYEKDQQQLAKKVSDLDRDYAERRNELNQRRTRLAGQLTASQEAKKKVETDLNAKITEAEGEISDYSLSNSLLEEKVARIEWQDPGQADAMITWVDHRGGQAFLDVGSADGLQPRMTFTVFDEEETNIDPVRKKGILEVLRILGPHRAVAKIIDKDVARLILPKDVVYSAAWDRGRRLRFGLAPGLLDIDDDGESDRQKIRDLIAMNGGIVDFDVDDEGQPQGELSINTRYVIIGEIPTEIKSGSDDETLDNLAKKEQERMARVIQQSTELYEQAKRFSVERISVDKFVDLVGWEERDKSVRLDAVSRFDELIEGEEGEEKNDDFRERRPLGN